MIAYLWKSPYCYEMNTAQMASNAQIKASICEPY